jgi:Integrase core domain
MANCSSSALMSGRRRLLNTCRGACGRRRRDGRHFLTTMSTASWRWICSSSRRCHFRHLFGLLILRHDRHEILWLGVTGHPTAEWIARQLTEAFGREMPPRYLVRDRDHAYGDVFVRRVRAMGIRDRPTAARSPWQNGYCERAIGSIRRDCLDHIIVFGERHLRHLLGCYASHYNKTRIGSDLRALIRRMSIDNPPWGAPRIHGELLKRG